MQWQENGCFSLTRARETDSNIYGANRREERVEMEGFYLAAFVRRWKEHVCPLSQADL